MLFNIGFGKSLKERLEYLYSKEYEEIYFNKEKLMLYYNVGPYKLFEKRRYIKYLISFYEGRKEVKDKINNYFKMKEKEFYDNILNVLLYPHNIKNLIYSYLAHLNTDNYHLHITILDFDYLNKKKLNLRKDQIELHIILSRLFEKIFYFDFTGTGEDISTLIYYQKTKKEDIKKRMEIKKMIANTIYLLLRKKRMTREEIIEFLKKYFKIKKVGEDYIVIQIKKERYKIKSFFFNKRLFNYLYYTKDELIEKLIKILKRREDYFMKRKYEVENAEKIAENLIEILQKVEKIVKKNELLKKKIEKKSNINLSR